MSNPIGSFFAKIGHALASFFGAHQVAIQSAIQDAQIAAGAATQVAEALGENPSVAAEIAKVSDGLSKVSYTVTAETTAQTLTDHAGNLAGLAIGLTSDLGIKNEDTQNAVIQTVKKVQGVVGALETAATVAPAGASTASSTVVTPLSRALPKL